MKKAHIQRVLNLCFKGSRNYVYASDVFMHMQKLIQQEFTGQHIDSIDFSTHKMAHHVIEVFIFDENVTRDDTTHAIFSFKANHKNYFCLLKETNAKITCKNPYDETLLFESFDLDIMHKYIETKKQYDYSVMDIFTSLNKLLLTKLFPENTKGWLSVRTKLDKLLPTDYTKLSVQFVKNFSNKYYQSLLFLDDKQIGQIFFSIK